MLVGIITNREKDHTLTYTQQVQNFLTQHNISIAAEDNLTQANFWVVLGGDGTVLRHSQLAARYDIPLLGINLGTVGFLTDVEQQDGLDALKKVLDGNFTIEKRLMLQVVKCGERYIALNDAVVGASGRLKTFSIYVNDVLLDTIRADGVIVATPTGSTAYNLSAHGPILMPGGNMMVVTPICPHNLSTRPLVIGAEDTVCVKSHQLSALHIDGESMEELAPGEDIKVQKAAQHTSIIKTTQADFHTVLRMKKLI